MKKHNWRAPCAGMAAPMGYVVMQPVVLPQWEGFQPTVTQQSAAPTTTQPAPPTTMQPAPPTTVQQGAEVVDEDLERAIAALRAKWKPPPKNGDKLHTTDERIVLHLEKRMHVIYPAVSSPTVSEVSTPRQPAYLPTPSTKNLWFELPSQDDQKPTGTSFLIRSACEVLALGQNVAKVCATMQAELQDTQEGCSLPSYLPSPEVGKVRMRWQPRMIASTRTQNAQTL
jgi:hypothetical protein